MDYFRSGDLVATGNRIGWSDRVGVFIKFVGGPIFGNTDRCCEVLFRGSPRTTKLLVSQLDHYEDDSSQ